MQYSQEINSVNIKAILWNIIEQPGWKTILAAITVSAEWVFGSNLQALGVVALLIVLDTITGTMKAAKSKSISSSGFFRFAAKLTIYLILMATAALVDKALPLQVGAAIMYTFLAVTEGLSILENVSALGWPVPAKLVDLLHKTSKPKESK